MYRFTDIHTHILAAVDDGAQDLTQTQQLLQMAWDHGTTAVFLTPHYRGKYKLSPAALKEKYQQLLTLMQDALPDMKIYLGSEIAYEVDTPEYLLAGDLLTLHDSQYVLLEFGTTALEPRLLSGISETVRCGFIPIIAHAEHCVAIRKKPALAAELREMGAFLQLNADSIMGHNGFGTKRLCHRLLKSGLADFIASDAHDDKKRPPLLQKCFLRIQKKYGAEYANRLFCENPQAIVENTIIY